MENIQYLEEAIPEKTAESYYLDVWLMQTLSLCHF